MPTTFTPTVSDLMARLGGPRIGGVPTAKQLLPGKPEAVPERGTSERTAIAYDYLTTTPRGEKAWAAQYRDKDGKVVCQHVRTMGKAFSWVARPKDVELQLFGQHLGGKGTLVITEGEVDAMSVYEVIHMGTTVGIKGNWSVVSIPDGAGQCVKPLQRNMAWIEGFDRVILWFDQDDAGRDGLAKAREVFDKAPAEVQQFPYKDANEALQKDDRRSIVAALLSAQAPAPDGVTWAMTPQVLDQVLAPSGRTGLQFPWIGWNRKTRGMRPCDLMILAGGTSIGKSAFSRACALHWLQQQIRVAYLGLEEPAWMTVERMASVVMGEPIYADTEEQRHQRDQGPLLQAINAFAPSLYLVDKWKDQSFDSFRRACRHYVQEHQCEVIVLDHFSWLAAKMQGNDKQGQIERCITELKELVNSLGTRMIVVTHLSRSDVGEDPERGGRPKLSQLRGSQALAQVPDQVVLLQRNPQAEDQVEANTTTCWLEKNRLMGDVGEMARLQYLRSGEFHEIAPPLT